MKYFAITVCMIIAFLSKSYSQFEFSTYNDNVQRGIIMSETSEDIKIRLADLSVMNLSKNLYMKRIPISAKIYLFNGEVVKGHIEKEDDSLMYVRSGLADVQKISKKFVQKLKFVSSYENKSNGVIGLSALAPAGFNIVFGYNIGQFGLRTSMGAYPSSLEDVTGIQLNALYNLGREKNMESNISVSFGYSRFLANIIEYNTDNYYYSNQYNFFRYVGLNYDFQWKGFFIEGGFAYGLNTDKAFISLQVGYLLRILE